MLMLFTTIGQIQVSYAVEKEQEIPSTYAVDNTGLDTSSILEINMHDYTGDDYRGKPREVINQYPINANRPFTFQFYMEDANVYPSDRYDELGGSRWWNNYSQMPAINPPERYQKGIFDNVLQNGYPALSKATGNYGYSLQYLFDNNSTAAGVSKHFKNLNKLFREEGSTGYYTIDSSQDFVTLQPDGTFKHDTELGPQKNSFTPLDDITGSTDKHNMWFGMDVRGQFTIPVGKQINGRDMIYEFSGDDDMLVYIDDVLVLDLGGIHSNVTGSINFTTGQVEEMWRTAVQDQDEHGFIQHSINDSFKAVGKTWDDSERSKHTIKIFYLERGHGSSNCKIKMNLAFNLLPGKPTSNYRVTYKPNGSSGSDQVQNVTIGNPWTTKGAIFAKPGYVLESWNTRSDGLGTRYELNKIQTAIKNDLTLYAQWKPIPSSNHTVTYKANGGSGVDQQQIVSSENSWTTKGAIFAKPGYVLESWNTSQYGTGTRYGLNSMNGPLSQNLTLYAKWTPNKYTIVYDGNGSTGGATPSIDVEYDQTVKISQNGFIKDSFKFVEWNTEKNGSGVSYKPGDSVKNLASKDGDTIIMYAIWEEQLKVIYNGNGATSGTQKEEIVDKSKLDSEGLYTVHKNQNYTNFQKKNSQFDGWYWDSVVNEKDYATTQSSFFRDNKVNMVPYTELQKYAVHESQLPFRAVGFTALENNKSANSMKVVPMYAQWDKSPEVVLPETDENKALRTFYEGQLISETDLLKGLILKDTEDDATHKPLHARVMKIEYSAGKLENGNMLPSYSESFPNGMSNTDHLDTWFLKLEKDKTVTHKVTYEVTDSAGNTTQAVGEVYVKYNQFPTITAEDRYFTLEEANAGKITAEAILNNPLANGLLVVKDDEEGRFTTVGPNPKQVKLLDFNADEFKTFKEGGYRKVTLHTQDTYGPNGRGKEAVKQITIYVVDDGEIPDINRAKQIRFIDKKNYDKNKDVMSKTSMTESRMNDRNNNGGLHVNSVWYHDTAYRNLIENTFNKKDGKRYRYTVEQVNQIQAYVDQHGIGNIKEDKALANFANQFLK